jgi:SAM-dependent methyltransferase
MARDPSMTEYYARRAAEYERIYTKPERQADLAALRVRLAELLAGRRVYEVACGTGYWTHVCASAAASIHATDCTPEVLELARSKDYPPECVSFGLADAFALPAAPQACDAGLACFWWSHLRRGGQLADFLRGFRERLIPGSRLVFLDNVYVEGSSTPVSRRDKDSNTYQWRRLSDGTTHEVLKNFPTENEVRSILGEIGARSVRWELFPYYWLASAELT